MGKAHFAEEFKQEAVRQVVERGYSVPDVAGRLGVSIQSLYKWVKAYLPNAVDRYEAEKGSQAGESETQSRAQACSGGM